MIESSNIIGGDELKKIYTSDNDEFEKFKNEIEDFKILITRYSDTNVQPASYDISVGDTCKNLTTNEKIDIKEEGKITIDPNECLTIKTKEEIGIPFNCTALVTTKISLSMTGIFQVTSRIDPGYQGELDITLFNASKKSVTLRYGDNFANLVFLRIGKPVSSGYHGTPSAKAFDDYKPVLREEVEYNKKTYVDSLLKSGNPFDILTHLLEIQEQNFDSRLESLKSSIRRENRIYKFLITILILLLAGSIGGVLLDLIG